MRKAVLDNGAVPIGEGTGTSVSTGSQRQQQQQQQQQPDSVESAGSPGFSHPPESSSALARRGREGRAEILPPEMMKVIMPSLIFGSCTGALGAFSGVVMSIVRSTPSVMFPVLTAMQWFTLGSSYCASRVLVENAWGGREKLTRADGYKASTISGAFAGMMGGLLRGPRNVLPAMLVWSAVGAGGQAAVNAYSGLRGATGGFTWDGFLSSRWSPVTRLSDQDYERYLEERLLKVEAEIALLDDDVERLRTEGQRAVRLQPPAKAEPATGR